MIRKLILISAISLGMAFAQNPYETTETTQASSAPTNTVPAVSEDDPAWNISIHPVTLVLFSALGLKTVILDVERTVSPHLSALVRPGIIFVSSDYYDVEGASWDLYEFMLGAGVRYYVNPGHKGLYFDAQLMYERAGIDYDDSDVNASATANAFGPLFLTGWKFRTGRATFGIDLGVGYLIAAATAEGTDKNSAEKDMESVADSGFTFDMNITFGLAF
ncbi:MAG: hypothetical protein J5534_12690 [Fibrobacter sp.]|nr:hypothetical protein [Fibrobacter sp.]